MARDSKEEDMGRIPGLLHNIQMSNTQHRTEESNIFLFRDFIRSCSQPNGSNFPPLLLTAEDRAEIQNDKKQAIECEEQLAKRRQEKYFDLVDKVKSVLRRIESKRDSQKEEVCENTICTPKSKSTPSVCNRSTASGDCNNNPSPEQSETLSGHMNSFALAKYTSRKVSPGNIEDFTDKENYRRKVTKRKINSGRYSLPANFEAFHHIPSLNGGHEISEPKYYSISRPLSAFSDHPSLYTKSLQSSVGDATGQFPLKREKGLSPAWVNSVTGSQSSEISASYMDRLQISASSSNHSFIKKQRELLILEQKRLEDHFTALQGQLLAEFHQRQNELLQMYEGSIEVQSAHDKSMQSILERSNEPDVGEPFVLDISDKENRIENHTDDLPKSPFALSPRKTSVGNEKLTPDVCITARSFNSEASLPEFYDIGHFGVKTRRNDASEKGETRNGIEKMVKERLRLQISPKSEKKSTQSFGISLITSPKVTQLNSFESKAREFKSAQSHKFAVISAYAKGYLTRLLFHTEKVNGLVTTLKDANKVLNEMKTETSQSMIDRSFKDRVKAQLQSAQSELRKIFLDCPPCVRMQILEQNRRLLKEKQTRNENKAMAKITSQTRPRLSNATMKKRLSRQERQEKKPSKSDNTSTPSPSKVTKTTAVSVEIPSKNTEETATKLCHVVPTTTAKMTSTYTITTATTTSAAAIKKAETLKTTSSKPSGKVTKPRNKAAVTPNKRRTWDTGVLKPIQGRISPILPGKMRSSGEKTQSVSSSDTRKTEPKRATNYQASGIRGAPGTVGNSRVNSKTFKVDNRPQHHVARTGAKRSLAANLSNK